MNNAVRKVISVALTGMLMLSASAVTAMPTAVSAAVGPVLPTSFYGNVTVNGVAAPVDTIVTGKIVATVGSQGEGNITVTEAGKYGGPAGGDPKLSIQTNDDDDIGKTIEFYVQLPSWGAAAKANETATYDTGCHNLDLTATVVTATLEGHVSFPGRGTPPNSTWAEPFNVTLFEPGNLSHVLWTGIATTNNTGVFTVSGLTPDTYDIGIKNHTCLSELNTSVTLIAGDTTVVDFGTTREGDCNNDDWITGADRNLLYTGWGTHEGVIGWNPDCDLNRDGWLTGADRNLMYTYWGQHGDLVP